MSTRHTQRLRLYALLVVSCLLASCAGMQPASTPRNIIVLFADGAAGTQWELGRYASHYLRKQSFITTDVVMRTGTVGLLATHPADAMVTDSAAAATAMATGYKTNNGMIGMTPDGRAVPTLLETAKSAGKRIGIVTTAAVYDATPAAFSAHARSRYDSQGLVDQYLALAPDVLMGGGRDYFLPRETAGGQRTDGQDVTAAFVAAGYDYARNPVELRAAKRSRVLGLFAAAAMEAEIDRDPAREPSTADMTAAALRTLAQHAPGGFLLLVENESIDTAGHRNDVAALIRDLWAFDAAVQVALDFQRQHPDDTLIIVAGDHETGGLSVTNAYRDAASRAAGNRFYAASAQLDLVNGIEVSLDKAVRLMGDKPDARAIDAVVARHFPGFRLDADLRAALLERTPLERNFAHGAQAVLARMVSRQTAIYWGSTGHTTEPVVVGAIGPGAQRFGGYMQNTDFAVRLTELLADSAGTAP